MRLDILLFGGRGASSTDKLGKFTIEKRKDPEFKNYRTITLYIGKKQAGYLEYQDNNGNITINVIETKKDFQRRGVASKLLEELKTEYGDITYKFSAVLKDGDALLKKKTNILKKEYGNYYVKIK